MSSEMDSAFVLRKYCHYFQSLRDKDKNDLVGFTTLWACFWFCDSDGDPYLLYWAMSLHCTYYIKLLVASGGSADIILYYLRRPLLDGKWAAVNRILVFQNALSYFAVIVVKAKQK